MLHHIQRGALDKLATADRLLYSEIKPANLDGNVFGYHLKSLIRDGYALKNEDGSYSLLAKGREYIVRRYEDPSRSAHSIFLIVLQHDDSYLLRRRNVQPFLGYAGFIHGEPVPDLSIVEAAQKRLQDKTGLSVPLTIKGSALITQSTGGELHSYSHAVILYGETDETHILPGDETGENFWGSLPGTTQLLPSCYDVVAAIENNTTWFEASYHL